MERALLSPVLPLLLPEGSAACCCLNTYDESQCCSNRLRPLRGSPGVSAVFILLSPSGWHTLTPSHLDDTYLAYPFARAEWGSS